MSTSPRVLLISPQPYFAWRGSSIRVKFDVRGLADLGYQVDLLTIPIGQDEPATPARVIRVWNVFGSRDISIGPSVLKMWFDLLLLIRGFGLVLSNRYDVIHGTEEAGFLAWMLSKIRGSKSVYEKHSDAASYKKGLVQNLILKAYLGIEHFTCRHADLIICTGPGLFKQAKSIAPETLAWDISDIPSSLVEPDDKGVALARRKMTSGSHEQNEPVEDVTDDTILTTYVGSFAVYQGIDIIFGAIPKVLEQSDNVRFVIIGGSESEISDRRRTLTQQGVIEGKVSFLGLIPPDELPAYLAASDILMAPRKAGVNTPLKVLDYFKAGGAIVATDTQANRFILDSSCARLCEFSDQAFADAILSLSTNQSQRNEIADNGRKLYEEKFNFRVFTNLLGQAYNTMRGVA